MKKLLLAGLLAVVMWLGVGCALWRDEPVELEPTVSWYANVAIVGALTSSYYGLTADVSITNQTDGVIEIEFTLTAHSINDLTLFNSTGNWSNPRVWRLTFLPHEERSFAPVFAFTGSHDNRNFYFTATYQILTTM